MQIHHALILWCALALLATLNGLVREFSYADWMSELAAHQLSTLTAAFFSALLVWMATRRWPLASAPQAWHIGALWLLLTLVFEFGFGHFVAGHSWERLLADYNLLKGRLWPLFLLWMLILPPLCHLLDRRQS